MMRKSSFACLSIMYASTLSSFQPLSQASTLIEIFDAVIGSNEQTR